MVLDTVAPLEAAVALYRKLGFRTIAETDEEYLMVYDLTGQPDAASGIC